MSFQHQTLASGRWYTLTLCEQLGNIGSEVGRTLRARGDEKRFKNAFSRALELFDLTLNDSRIDKGLKEIARARELFCYAAFEDNRYNTTLEDLDRYFMQFAKAARKTR